MFSFAVLATVTNMKHSISKNDKAKKKEITNEIARLEAELAKRQSDELAEFKKKQTDVQESASPDGKVDVMLLDLVFF